MHSDWPPIPPVSKNLGDYRASQSQYCHVAKLEEEKKKCGCVLLVKFYSFNFENFKKWVVNQLEMIKKC